MKDEIKEISCKCDLFFNEISNEYIKINLLNVDCICDRIFIKTKINIKRFNLSFNYSLDLPLFKNMFNIKQKFDLSQRIKYDIYYYIVKFIKLDKLGENYEINI